MCADAMILLDTKNSGRYFNVRTGGVETFSTMQELQLLCQSALRQELPPAAGTKMLAHPEKGTLASLHISIYAVDQAGTHGTLHLSSARHDAFKSTDELEWLMNREIYLALKRQQRKASAK